MCAFNCNKICVIQTHKIIMLHIFIEGGEENLIFSYLVYFLCGKIIILCQLENSQN